MAMSLPMLMYAHTHSRKKKRVIRDSAKSRVLNAPQHNTQAQRQLVAIALRFKEQSECSTERVEEKERASVSIGVEATALRRGRPHLRRHVLSHLLLPPEQLLRDLAVLLDEVVAFLGKPSAFAGEAVVFI